MPRRRSPRYCHHKASGQACVYLDGQQVYLRPYDSPESRTRYQELLRKLDMVQRHPDASALTVGELVLWYDDFLVEYYQKDGQPTSEVCCTPGTAQFPDGSD